VDKVIGVLSGGEKARVSLAKLLVRPGNLMVMDEPTNHLDISSSEALITALSEYNGTLLFVSHNQSFINRLATKIWDIRDQDVVEYPGNLKEYDNHTASRAEESEGGSGRGVNGSGETSAKKAQDRKKEKREEAERRKLVYDTLKPIQEKVTQLEGRIERLESRKETLEKTLADPDFFSDKNRSVPLLSEYKIIREDLDGLLLKWEQALGRLEAVKRKMGVSDE
jgi:ATP-binding cassette subfamily F protein 3